MRKTRAVLQRKKVTKLEVSNPAGISWTFYQLKGDGIFFNNLF